MAQSFSIEEPNKTSSQVYQSPTLTKCMLFTSSILMILGALSNIITGLGVKAKYTFFNYSALFHANDYYNVTACRHVGIDFVNKSMVFPPPSKATWMLQHQCNDNFTRFLFEEYWLPRAAANPGMLFSSFCHVFALLFLLPSIYFLTRLYRRNEYTNLSDLCTACFHLAITMFLLEITFHLGQTTFMNWFSFVEAFALPFTGVHSINTLFLISKALDGVFLWLFTVNNLLFSCGIACISFMTIYGSEAVLSNRHAYLGFVMATLAILGFLFGLMRFWSWRTFSFFNHVSNFLSLGICFPIWLIWTAFSLRSVPKEQYDSLLRT